VNYYHRLLDAQHGLTKALTALHLQKIKTAAQHIKIKNLTSTHHNFSSFFSKSESDSDDKPRVKYP